MGTRRIVLVASVASVVAWLAQPALRRAASSMRTSSAPGVSVYDLAAGVALGGYYRDIATECAAALAGVDAPSILEVGPGPGHLAERLLRQVPEATWTGLDVDPAMLRATQRRIERSGLAERAALVEGGVESIPSPDGSFDLVVSSLSVHHWSDPVAGFAEIRRVLRPGGRALVYDLPVSWAHAETGSAGLDAAAEVFGAHERTRMRGVGPLTIVWRADLRH